jgi:ATP-dependent DNA helicase PIF1
MADVLIVDEVSMMTPDLLEKLEEIAKGIRRSSKTMGGLQVIFVGDFYQLPPVNKTDEETVFVFESPHWTRVLPKTIQLTQIVRQTDPVFQKILQEARMATLSEESIAILRSRKGLDWKSQIIRPTLLFSRKAEVDLVNSVNLKALKGEKKLFKASTVFLPVQATVGIDQKSSEFQNAVQKMDRDSQYVSELTLAVNAQVMLLINLDTEAGLVNGSRGVITGFTSGPNQVPLVQFKTGSPIPIEEFTWNSDQIEGLQRKQIPLCLAYAVTIHKAQGATLDSALIDIGQSTFESGQAYVALSRVRSLDSLYVWDLEVSAFKTNSKVVAYYSSLVSGSK